MYLPQLIIFMFLRTILNTAHRMVYPFLPIFARGLGVDISTMSLLMTGRSLIGATSPLFASIGDRRGRKFGMLLGTVIFTLGVGLVAIHPNIWTLAAVLILAVRSSASSSTLAKLCYNYLVSPIRRRLKQEALCPKILE